MYVGTSGETGAAQHVVKVVPRLDPAGRRPRLRTWRFMNVLKVKRKSRVQRMALDGGM